MIDKHHSFTLKDTVLLKYLLLIVLLLVVGGVASIGFLDFAPPPELHKKVLNSP